MNTRCTMRVALLFCVVLVCGCTDAAPNTNRSVSAAHPFGWPELMLVYSCDTARAGELGKRVLIPDKHTYVIETKPEEVVYFFVDALFTNKAGSIKHTRMHFVLGTQNNGSARAVIHGKNAAGNDPESLVKLDKGWLWVSDAPPPNWSGGLPAPVTVPPQDAASFTTGPIVSWSLITLIRGVYTHSGADMTGFTFAVDELANPKSLLFVTKAGEVAYHRRTKNNGTVEVEVKAGHSSGVKANGDPDTPRKLSSNPTSDPAKLIKSIQCRVTEVRAVPVGSSECHVQHKGCLP